MKYTLLVKGKWLKVSNNSAAGFLSRQIASVSGWRACQEPTWAPLLPWVLRNSQKCDDPLLLLFLSLAQLAHTGWLRLKQQTSAFRPYISAHKALHDYFWPDDPLPHLNDKFPQSKWLNHGNSQETIKAKPSSLWGTACCRGIKLKRTRVAYKTRWRHFTEKPLQEETNGKTASPSRTQKHITTMPCGILHESVFQHSPHC